MLTYRNITFTSQNRIMTKVTSLKFPIAEDPNEVFQPRLRLIRFLKTKVEIPIVLLFLPPHQSVHRQHGLNEIYKDLHEGKTAHGHHFLHQLTHRKSKLGLVNESSPGKYMVARSLYPIYIFIWVWPLYQDINWYIILYSKLNQSCVVMNQ